MAEMEHNLIPGLLLMMLSFVLATSIFVVYLVLRLRQQDGIPAKSKSNSEMDFLPTALSGQKYAAFKRLNCWLAIRNRNLPAIQSALALHDVRPCSWVDGVAGESNEKLFISPPISGWVLVIGSALPNPSDDVDVSFHFLRELSRKLGHVQFFSANGILNQHCWARVDSGRIVRAYAWSGRTLWNQGEVTAAEKELNMKCYDYEQCLDGPSFGSLETDLSNLEKIHLLAARWSLDPDELDDQFVEKALGIVGEPARHF